MRSLAAATALSFSAKRSTADFTRELLRFGRREALFRFGSLAGPGEGA